MGDPQDRLVRAAGCVVWRPGAEGPEFLVAHRPRYDDWSFPKGKLEAGEDWLEGAVREVEEETGVTGVIGAALDAVEYVDHKGRQKQVRYWVMRADPRPFVANDEVDEISWLGPGDVRAQLTYPRDQLLLDQAVAALDEARGGP